MQHPDSFKKFYSSWQKAEQKTRQKSLIILIVIPPASALFLNAHGFRAYYEQKTHPIKTGYLVLFILTSIHLLPATPPVHTLFSGHDTIEGHQPPVFEIPKNKSLNRNFTQNKTIACPTRTNLNSVRLSVVIPTITDIRSERKSH